MLSPLAFSADKTRGRDRALWQPPGQQAVVKAQEEGQAGELLLILTEPLTRPWALLGGEDSLRTFLALGPDEGPEHFVSWH